MSKKSYYNIKCPHCDEKFGEDESCELSVLIDECYDDGWEDCKKSIEKQRLEEGDGAILTDVQKIIELQKYGHGISIEQAYEQITEAVKRRKYVTD